MIISFFSLAFVLLNCQGKLMMIFKLCALFFVSLDVRVKSDGIKIHFSVFRLTVRWKADDLQLYSVYIFEEGNCCTCSKRCKHKTICEIGCKYKTNWQLISLWHMYVGLSFLVLARVLYVDLSSFGEQFPFVEMPQSLGEHFCCQRNAECCSLGLCYFGQR
jgi:hypothetical protein